MVVDKNNEWSLTLFDWEMSCHCWFMVDVGTIILHHFLRFASQKALTPATAEEGYKISHQFTEWVCEAYGPDVNRVHLREGIEWRKTCVAKGAHQVLKFDGIPEGLA